MLFDLRSRGRRRTVQAVYLGLALLMGGGLVLFGVGAGNGFGGILNAFTGNGSGNNQKQVVSAQETQALRQTQANPNDPTGWANLLQARWTNAGQGSNYDTATGTFTAAGKKELAGAVQAWQRYRALVKSPDPNLTILAARANAALGDWGAAANAWEDETLVSPTESKAYECLAVTSYAAGQARKGDLATAKALSLLPKAQQPAIKQSLQQAQKSPSAAQQLAQQC
jgi:predicted Zn-dependent protease